MKPNKYDQKIYFEAYRTQLHEMKNMYNFHYNLALIKLSINIVIVKDDQHQTSYLSQFFIIIGTSLCYMIIVMGMSYKLETRTPQVVLCDCKSMYMLMRGT